jgi:hypothetical protein
MLNPENLQGVLQDLTQALYNHEQWQKELTRTIICRLPCDQRDVADEAHRQCRFGQWYYGGGSAELRDRAVFGAMEGEHQRMHQLAARLLKHPPMNFRSFRRTTTISPMRSTGCGSRSRR